MAVAACFLIAVILFGNIYYPGMNNQGELASVSPEMAETQDFYASVINKELYKLEQEKTPETQTIIQDALKHLEILENDYNKLKTDLVKSGQDQRVDGDVQRVRHGLAAQQLVHQHGEHARREVAARVAVRQCRVGRRHDNRVELARRDGRHHRRERGGLLPELPAPPRGGRARATRG